MLFAERQAKFRGHAVAFEHVDGFTVGAAGGNGAGVVVDDDDDALDDEARRAVAAALGFSETVFVARAPPAGCDVAMRYFTPVGEVDLCGHATVAALGHLRARGRLGDGGGVLRARAGDVKFAFEPPGGDASGAAALRVFMEQLAPTIDAPLGAASAASPADVARALGGDGVELASAWPPRVASTGLRDLLVAVRSPLGEMRPDFAAVARLSEALGTVGVHAFELGDAARDGSAGAPIRVRNFAPLYDIDEESATGTSNCALACALRASGALALPGEGGGELHFAQGEGMGAPSRIVARPPVAPGSRPWVGGQFCWRCAGRVELDVDDAGATRGRRVD